jgi:methenyltetrahydrofolate cyclohydrolase
LNSASLNTRQVFDMTDFGSMTLREFSDALASTNPTPGGGSAAAVSLSQAAALTVMVSDITLGREKWEKGWEAAENSKSIATPLILDGLTLADEDTDSFISVMDTFKLPKDSDQEKESRKQAIRNATHNASLVPLKTAKQALQLLETQSDLATYGNGNAVTDVGVASLLASAACKGALFNVEINATSLPSEMAEPLMAEVKTIRESARELSRSVMKAVYARLEN